jgi:hypothetical protein
VGSLKEVGFNELKMSKCVGKRKTKQEQWGPILVERQRRRRDNGVPVMERAMELKKKKNLEHVRGNPFASLQFDNLINIVKDVNLKSGNSSNEARIIIDDLILDEQCGYDNFIESNPDTLLPPDLEVDIVDNCNLKYK